MRHAAASTRTCRSRDTGAAQFVDAHPTWDGRGVTIGIVDSGRLRSTIPACSTTSTGERKIVDWVTGTDPLTDDDPTWLNMENQVSGATFTFEGVTYTAPGRRQLPDRALQRARPAPRRRGRQRRQPRRQPGRLAAASSPCSGIRRGQPVWVDTNQNRIFADETAMTDYKVNRDVD